MILFRSCGALQQAFCQQYGTKIAAALEALSNPTCGDKYDPERVWKPMEHILNAMRRRSKRRLDLQSLSPRLARLQESAIPMPGLSTGEMHSIVNHGAQCAISCGVSAELSCYRVEYVLAGALCTMCDSPRWSGTQRVIRCGHHPWHFHPVVCAQCVVDHGGLAHNV